MISLFFRCTIHFQFLLNTYLLCFLHFYIFAFWIVYFTLGLYFNLIFLSLVFIMLLCWLWLSLFLLILIRLCQFFAPLFIIFLEFFLLFRLEIYTSVKLNAKGFQLLICLSKSRRCFVRG